MLDGVSVLSVQMCVRKSCQQQGTPAPDSFLRKPHCAQRRLSFEQPLRGTLDIDTACMSAAMLGRPQMS